MAGHQKTKIISFIIIIVLILTAIIVLIFIYPPKQKDEIVIAPKVTVPIIPKDTSEFKSGDKFYIEIVLEILGEDSTGGNIKITKNGVPYQTINSEGGLKYPAALDFNAKYLIECSKKNYVTKVVFFDTHIPKGREKEEFARFTATVELHKAMKGEIVNSTKPVGGVKYDPVSDDFEKVKN